VTLKSEIEAVDPAVLATGDYETIAAAVSAGRKQIVSHEGGVGTIMNALGPDGGAALLDQLEAMAATSPAVKWGMKLILAGTFNFGMASSRAMIDLLVPEPARTALKAVAERDAPVSASQVASLMTGGA